VFLFEISLRQFRHPQTSDFSKTLRHRCLNMLPIMKSAAIGIRMHSGWGVLVTVSDQAEVIDRRRIVIVRENATGGKMPFHHAEGLGLPKAESYLESYTAECDCLASQEIVKALEDLKAHGYQAIAAGLVLASGRALPKLAQILASHPLIHTAEGELFRDVVRRACESLGIPVLGYRERDLPDQAKELFAAEASKLITRLTGAGKTLGPPWTADHKSAALAACLSMRAELAEPRKAKPTVIG
jgi:hypothetical protein